MSTAELLAIIEKLAISQAETDRQMKATDKKIKEIGRQVGNIGNKFGSFTEGMATKSIRKILMEQFGMEYVGYSKITKKDKQEEYDLLSYCNGEVNKGIIVEIKSKLDTDVIAQMERKMRDVFDWLPDHRGKTFEGMITPMTDDHSDSCRNERPDPSDQ